MTRSSVVRLVAGFAGPLVAAATLAVAAPHPTVAHADAAGHGGDFVPLSTPGRLVDTRHGTGITGKLTTASTHAFPVLGHAGVPATNVRAVLLNVVSVAPSVGTFFTLWPDGTTKPVTSVLNVLAGETISNTDVVAPGADGKVALFNEAGSTDAVVDVEGYFTQVSTTGGTGGFVPVTQTRLVDTRSGTGAPRAAIPPNGKLTVDLATPPVPTTANAVFVTVLVPGASHGGYVSAFPAGGTDGLPVINFGAGNTAEGASLKLGQNGGVTLVNHSGASVHLVIDVEGYFVATPAQGAGLNPVAARVLDTRTAGVPIPAGGTVDVSVGGTNGLPTRDIAGAVLNVTSFHQTSPGTGFLRAWPLGDPEPTGTSLDNFSTDRIRSDDAVIRPGTEGKVRIRNLSSGTVQVVVDLEGWFADPLPPVGVEQFAPVAAVQATPAAGAQFGTVEYAYTDNVGILRHGHQSDPDSFASVTWTAISPSTVAFTGRPGLAQQADGRLQAVAHEADSNVTVNTEVTADPPVWGSWTEQGGSMASHPVVVRQSDSTLAVFAVDADGQLWVMSQNGVNGPYGPWRSLGPADLVGTPAAVAFGTGVQVFGVDDTGAVRTATFAAGVLTGWTSLGGTGFTGTPAVMVVPGRLRVFARASDGSVQTKIQDDLGAFPPDWETLPGVTAAGSPAAILSPITSTAEVIVRGTDGAAYSNGETGAGSGTWRGWAQVAAAVGSDPTTFALTNSNGTGWAFVVQRPAGTPEVFTVSPPALAAARPAVAAGPTFAAHSLPAPPR